MNRLLILLCILISGSLYAQVHKSYAMPEDTTVYSIVDKDPEFQGGRDAMYKFIYSNFNYQKMGEIDVQGKIFVQFVVEKNGCVSNIKITRNLDPFCDSEAIRIIRLMPKWKPGEFRNKKVRTKIEIPITVRLE
ncbi:MAG: energy transducer TonB [Bacteroidota bacterium]|nr:energy transducer TonB [Bacteroidota bacterium]